MSMKNKNPKGKCGETDICISCYQDCHNQFPSVKNNKEQKKSIEKCFKVCKNKKGADNKKICIGGSSHINIVGPPTSDGKKYHIIDVSCKKEGICTYKNWIYPDFLYKKTYCGKNPTEPLLAGEAWKYVYRMIPECMDVVNNIGFSTKNSGVRVT